MVTPERVEEVKDLFQDLAKQAIDYYELKSYVEGMWSGGEFSDEEYDLIWEHWEEWLPPKTKTKTKPRKKTRKRTKTKQLQTEERPDEKSGLSFSAAFFLKQL